VAEQFTGTPGVYVPIEETIRGFDEILQGKHDDLPERAFFMKGTIEDVVRDAGGASEENSKEESGDSEAQSGDDSKEESGDDSKAQAGDDSKEESGDDSKAQSDDDSKEAGDEEPAAAVSDKGSDERDSSDGEE
jgi:hypothetical protein